MARSLKLEVIAEGVENEEQYEFLKHKSCNEMQGFYFSKPLPPERVVELFGVRTGKRLPI
jgi:EAL domain-containing protein (putative c-di-GMP-specific phosphodiesterase class I)